MAGIPDGLDKIRNLEYLAVPKSRYRTRLPESLMSDAVEKPHHWLIPCSHVFHAPASEAELATINRTLDLPAQLQSFLRLTNGAELFRLHYQPKEFRDSWITMYEVFSVSELLRTNQEILEIFLSYAEADQKFRNIRKLNYLAFCNIGDGNYLAINLKGPDREKMFFLDHDYCFYPLGTEDTEEAYVHVANSLEDWLELLVRTSGAEGTGSRFIPL